MGKIRSTGDDVHNAAAPEGGGLQRALRLLEIQRDLATDLCRAVDQESAFATLLRAAMSLPGFDCGGVYARDEHSGALKLVAHHGLSEAFVAAAARHEGDSAQARLVAAGNLVYMMRSDLPPPIAANLAREGLEALAVIPLKDQGRVIGSLNVSCHFRPSIDEGSRLGLESLAAQAEGAIALIQARSARLEAETRLRLATEGAGLGIWMLDRRDGSFDATPRARQLHGQSETGPFSDLDARSAIHPEDREAVLEALSRLQCPGDHMACEYRTTLPGAAALWIRSEASLHGERVYGIVRDVTRRRLAEEELREARDQLERRVAERTAELLAANEALREQSMRLELALDASRAGTSTWVIGSDTVEWDNRERALFGFAEGEKVTFGALLERIHPDDRQHFLDRLEQMAGAVGSDVWQHEFRVIHPLLGERWLGGLGRVERSRDGKVRRLSGINFDITERKRIEQSLRDLNESLERRVAERTAELRRGQARFRQLAAAAFEGIAITENGILIDGNAQLGALHGCRLEDMVGQGVEGFIAPEFRALVRERIRSGDERVYEYTAMRVDGSVFPAEARPRMLTWDGKPTRVTAIRDLSDAKRAAALLEAQRIELEQAQRLALVSEISAGVMHQVSQPVVTISNNVAAARAISDRVNGPEHEVGEILEDIEADLARIRATVVGLRALAHPEHPNRVGVTLGDLLAGMLELMRDEARARRFELCLDCPTPDLALRVDRLQLEQVLLNLVRNAFEATAACGSEQRVVSISGHTTEQGQAAIEVCDRGGGIPDEVMPRLFSPFFTTKPDGFGIGLRLSRTIIQAHGGSIQAFNRTDGPGACFRILLPGDVSPQTTDGKTTPPAGGTPPPRCARPAT